MDEWESKVNRLPQIEMIKVYNEMNTNLNMKYSHSSNIINHLSKEGYKYMRKIECLQKLNPEMADRIHQEVHY